MTSPESLLTRRRNAYPHERAATTIRASARRITNRRSSIDTVLLVDVAVVAVGEVLSLRLQFSPSFVMVWYLSLRFHTLAFFRMFIHEI